MFTVGLDLDNSVVGEITQGSNSFNSRSPPVICHYPILGHFGGYHLSGPTGEDYNYIGVADPTTMYIYSLRHFLTTKGALIDGDGYPPKNPNFDPKMTPKSD